MRKIFIMLGGLALVGVGVQAQTITSVGSLSSAAGAGVLPLLNDAVTVANAGLSGAEVVWLTLAGLAAIGAIIGFLRRKRS